MWRKRRANEKNTEVGRLIELVNSGDQDAFPVLVKMYEPMLRKTLKLYTTENMSREDVEDLEQEQLIAFYRAIASFKQEQDDVEFGLYAKICVSNSMASYKRALRKRSREDLVGDERMNCIYDPASEVSHYVEMRESDAELDRQIERTLSDYENEVWLCYVDGYSTRDIAERLGSSEKSVDNAIFRIRKKLKALLRAD